jgi:DNA-binding winged helix-turn-helix (wHTH) protein
LRYRFANFVVSPRRRLVLRDGVEQPLIPRYFDLLVFLIERRHEAVHRRDIFDRVWSDVIVSDSALSQAVRTLRRTLADHSREPRFIRTVSRHGYRFVFPDVFEEADDDAVPAKAGTYAKTAAFAPGAPAPRKAGTEADSDADGTANTFALPPAPDVLRQTDDRSAPEEPVSDTTVGLDTIEALLVRIARPPASDAEEEDQREAAEILHASGTTEALQRLGTRPGHELARALLRDTRWETPTAGRVPIAGVPGSLTTAFWLVRLRLRRAARIAAVRWAAGAIGAGLAGGVAGALGGLLLSVAPGSHAPVAVAAVLALIGGACGAMGGAGVAAGLAASETVARSRRTLALLLGGAAGGTVAGLTTQILGQVTLANLVGLDLSIGGGLDGLVIGAAAGFAYAVSTAQTRDGLAAPRGRQRSKVVLLMVAACASATFTLSRFDRPLVGGTIHMIATAARGAQATLTPFGHLVGEPDFGPLSRTIIGTLEGALFGLGLSLGLTRRPRHASSTPSHETLTTR